MGDDDIFSRLGHSNNPLESNINFLKWKRTTNYTYNCLIQKEISKKYVTLNWTVSVELYKALPLTYPLSI